MNTNKSALTALLFAAASLGAPAAEITVSDSVISGQKNYGSDSVTFNPGKDSTTVTFESGTEVSAGKITIAADHDAVTADTTFTTGGQFRVNRNWTGSGDAVTAGGLWLGGETDVTGQTWNISGSVQAFGRAAMKISDSTLRIGGDVQVVLSQVVLKNCDTLFKHESSSAMTMLSYGSLTVSGGTFKATGAAENAFSVGANAVFSVEDGATVDLTAVKTSLTQGGTMKLASSVLNIGTKADVPAEGAVYVSDFSVYSGTLEAKEIAVEAGQTLNVSGSSAISAETLTVSEGATVSVGENVTLNVSALSILSSEESLSAGTTLDLNTIFGGNSAALEKVLGDVGEQISVKDASGNVYSCKYSSGDTFVTIVPEPSAFGLLAGAFAFALALCAARRRRKA